jgi:hypothetical protein
MLGGTDHCCARASVPAKRRKFQKERLLLTMERITSRDRTWMGTTDLHDAWYDVGVCLCAGTSFHANQGSQSYERCDVLAIDTARQEHQHSDAMHSVHACDNHAGHSSDLQPPGSKGVPCSSGRAFQGRICHGISRQSPGLGSTQMCAHGQAATSSSPMVILTRDHFGSTVAQRACTKYALPLRLASIRLTGTNAIAGATRFFWFVSEILTTTCSMGTCAPS